MKSLYVLFLLPFAALAGTPNDGPPENPPQEPLSWEQVIKMNPNQEVGVETKVDTATVVKTEVENTNVNKVDGGDATAIANGGEGGQGGEGGDAIVGPINVTGGGVNINHPRQPVASAYAPSNYPSAMCQASISAGAQFKFFGFSFGKNYTVLESCLMVLAQQWMAMGEYALACEALMATKSADRAHDPKNDEKIRERCANVHGPAPQGTTASAPQIIMVAIPVQQGQQSPPLTVEHLNQAFEQAMKNK